MMILRRYGAFMAMLSFLTGILIFSGCDSGEKVIDKATGNQDVKQFQKMKKDIGKIADQQAEKYNDILDDKKIPFANGESIKEIINHGNTPNNL